LEKRIEKSTEIIKNRKLKERSKKAITNAMRTANNRAEFEKALEKQGISVLFRENEQGRIYGATFIDHEQKCVFNGSRLGKEFSANVFNQLFNEKTEKAENKTLPKKSHLSQKSQPSQNNKEKDFTENSNSGGIFDFLALDNSTNEDFEEQAFARNLKKKKKKRINL